MCVFILHDIIIPVFLHFINKYAIILSMKTIVDLIKQACESVQFPFGQVSSYTDYKALIEQAIFELTNQSVSIDKKSLEHDYYLHYVYTTSPDNIRFENEIAREQSLYYPVEYAIISGSNGLMKVVAPTNPEDIVIDETENWVIIRTDEELKAVHRSVYELVKCLCFV
ncbi:MAG: hypothetical protein RXO36_02425 [Candidatus Nanopusillus acidilobi]